MSHADFEFLATLRLTVGFLGEQGSPRWWASNFFGAGSEAFLAPTFPRTVLLARHHGVVQSAAKVHDEHTGVGRLYHLFRLPEDLEYALHVALQTPPLIESVAACVRERGDALQWLQKAAAGEDAGVEGPVRLGDAASLRQIDAWRLAAARYSHAFARGVRVYPYFSDVR